MAETSVSILQLERSQPTFFGPDESIDWFCWDWPVVTKRVKRSYEVEHLEHTYSFQMESGLGPEWSLIRPDCYDGVYWTFDDAPALVCNGINIRDANRNIVDETEIGWPDHVQLGLPKIAVLDSAANLPVTTQRYRLSQKTVPFLAELTRDVTLSFIAHALVCGPDSRRVAPSSLYGRHPLSYGQVSSFEGWEGSFLAEGKLRWTFTPIELVPSDPWLYSLLNAESCFVIGEIAGVGGSRSLKISPFTAGATAKLGPVFDEIEHVTALDQALLVWPQRMNPRKIGEIGELSIQFLSELLSDGVVALGHEVESSRIAYSVNESLFIDEMFPAKSGAEHLQRKYQSNVNRPRFGKKLGNITSPSLLESMLDRIEGALMDSRMDLCGGYSEGGLPDVIFVAELKTKSVSRSPKSLIAQIWNECLGPKAIPFDGDARRALIDHGRKHPELNRHIEAWEKMKKMNSEKG